MNSEFQLEKIKRDNLVFQSSTVDDQNSAGNSEPKFQVDHFETKSKENSAITCDLNIISTDNNLLLEGNEESNIKLATNNDKRVWINPEATDAKLTSNQITYL